jgi:hypothetical protein
VDVVPPLDHALDALIATCDWVCELLPVSRTPSLGVMMEPEVGYGTKATWA